MANYQNEEELPITCVSWFQKLLNIAYLLVEDFLLRQNGKKLLVVLLVLYGLGETIDLIVLLVILDLHHLIVKAVLLKLVLTSLRMRKTCDLIEIDLPLACLMFLEMHGSGLQIGMTQNIIKVCGNQSNGASKMFY